MASVQAEGKSFSDFFGESPSAYNVDEEYAVNNLFLQSRYDEDGTFYYSAFENFATLKDDEDRDFTVYEQLGSPRPDRYINGTDKPAYFFMRGNFFPYNTLKDWTMRPCRSLPPLP